MDAEICFPYGFQDHPKGFLYNPVKQDWDTKWSLFIAVWFGYVHPSHRTWFKGFGAIPLKSPCQPFSLELSNPGVCTQALNLLGFVSPGRAVCQRRVITHRV